IHARYRAAKYRQRMLEDRIEDLSDRLWEGREAEKGARSLLEAQGDIIVRRDTSGRITYANHAFCKLAGKPRDALIGSAAGPGGWGPGAPATPAGGNPSTG